MPGPQLKQNRQDRIINKLYTLYDTIEYINLTCDIVDYARDIIVSALRREIKILTVQLSDAEENPDDEGDEQHARQKSVRSTFGT